MNEFSAFIFKQNELKTSNKKVISERAYLIGILITLTGLLLYFLNIEYSIAVLVVGAVITTIGRIVMSGKNPSIGYRPLELKLKNQSLIIGNEEIEIKANADVLIKIAGYKGQLINQRIAFYKKHSGDDNIIKLRHGDMEVEFNFVLESEHHKDKLIAFCENNGFDLRK